MALEIEKKRGIFKIKQIWFADYPYDVKGVDRVIFRDCKNKVDIPGFSCKEFTTLVIDLSQDLDKIWNNMGKSSCKYKIRRATREGIKIKINQNFEDFIKIDKLFRKTKNLPPSNITIKFIKKYGILLIAELGNEIVGGQLYLKDKDNVRLVAAPSKRFNVDKKKSLLIGMGNRLMVWEAIKYAKAKGIKEFDFGGYYTGKEKDEQKEKINIFKKSFGGKLVTHYIYQKDYSKIYKVLSLLKQKFIATKMIKRNILNIVSKIRGSSFQKEYCEAQSITDKDKLADFQKKYLGKMLLHTYKNVPYYRSVFQKIKIIDNNKIDYSKFDKIPILTKDIIRKNFKQLISQDLGQRKWFYNSSGGSTGKPLRFIQDDSRNKWGSAIYHYYYRVMLGIDELDAKKILFWGSERDIFEGSVGLKAKVNNWLRNTTFLNSFKMTEKDMDRYIKTINSLKPDLIRGYTGSLYELCKYAKKNNIEIYKPKILICGAETLSDEMRKEIEIVFKTKLYDFYGSRETSCLSGECRHNSMHMLMFNNYIEILNKNNKPVAEGEEGRIIVTCLHNYAMPLIRYEIEDMAVLGPKECKCKNPLPTLKKITGRITDHFIKRDGTLIHGEYFTHLFYLKDWIKEFQVIQENYEEIRVLVVLNGRIKVIEKKDIEDKIKLVMGQSCKVIWEFVESMPKTDGKYLYTKSKICNYV